MILDFLEDFLKYKIKIIMRDNTPKKISKYFITSLYLSSSGLKFISSPPIYIFSFIVDVYNMRIIDKYSIISVLEIDIKEFFVDRKL